jgi:hypothetical protein
MKSSTNTSLVDENDDCLAKVLLRTEIMSHLEKLKAAWAQEIPVPAVVEEVESEEEQINIGNLDNDEDEEQIDMSSDDEDE